MKRVNLFTMLATGIIAGTIAVNAGEHEGRGERGPKGPRSAAEILERLDKNGDGVLDVEELQVMIDMKKKRHEKCGMKDEEGRGPRGPRGHHGRGKDSDGKRPDKLKEADADGDGKVSKAEMLAKVEKHFAEMDVNGDGFVTEDEAKAARKNKMWERIDKDGNGVITEDEFKGPEGIFKKIDEDEDGSITKEEMERAHEQRRQKAVEGKK